ncbi:hypothetical protein SAMN04487900_11054 [Prevotella communis]|uniref:Uncharacterized protein n=1 Tax=Prevotella communis TaxID=2913614 RepID=A0A1H0GZR3_9BACT|nr:hypothetical protein [Prevotella communis]SDO12368.1 hypothetical protein SAMN04487900_11054 [Prevotella communis]
METSKKFLVYYNESKNLIGIREHHFDWEEGDDITTNGIRTTIFAIFTGTKQNIEMANWMMRTLRLHQPKKKEVIVLDDGYKYTGDWFDDMMLQLEHGHRELIDVNRKVWKNFDAQLDFVEEVVNRMN